MELGHRAYTYQKHIETRIVGFLEPHPDVYIIVKDLWSKMPAF